MKNLFIVLLVAAIGAGVFFFLRNKNSANHNDFKKEWILGKWKMDTFQPGKDSTAGFMVGIMGLIDSNFMKYHYEFTREGAVIRLLNDSASKDIAHYEWNKENQLRWKEDATDSTGTLFSVMKLSKDSLLIRDKDSVQVLFVKVK